MISFGPIDLRPTIPKDIPVFHSVLSEWRQVYDVPVTEGPFAFYSWWEREVDYALTALDVKSGDIVGCGYLTDLKEPYSACFHIFKKKGYANPRIVSKVCLEALPMLFEHNNIEKLLAIFPTDRKTVYRLSKIVGMKKDGILRHHWSVDGKWVDCYVMSLLRKEVGKWAVVDHLLFRLPRLLQQRMISKSSRQH